MEKLIGINEVRPKLTSLIEAAAESGEPYIVLSKSEPKAVLLSYQEYRRLQAAAIERQELLLRLALWEAASKAEKAGLTEDDVLQEVTAFRRQP